LYGIEAPKQMHGHVLTQIFAGSGDVVAQKQLP
jgi:hypothetical protein